MRRVFLVHRVVAILAAFASFGGYSYAQGKLQGCWNNIVQVPVNPKWSPTHVSTTASGEVICFRNGGAITTIAVGGFEALSSSGRFSIKSGHLTVAENEMADGWLFAHKKDRCDLHIFLKTLNISGCKDRSRVMVLHKTTTQPEMAGVAAGLAQ